MKDAPHGRAAGGRPAQGRPEFLAETVNDAAFGLPTRVFIVASQSSPRPLVAALFLALVP
jgi:hypothetical protein